MAGTDDLDSIIDGAGNNGPVATQASPVRLTDKDTANNALDDVINQNPISMQQQYGGAGQKLKTFGEGALDAATLGTGAGLENALFNNAAEHRARAEANPGSRMLGQVTGLVAPALVGDEAGILGTAGKVMGGAGDAVAGGLGLGAEGAGLASRLGAAAVKSAVEAAVFQGGDEVSKMLTFDPNQSIQSAAANIGMSGLLGGGFGVALGGAGELWNATIGKRLGSTLDAASSAIDGGPSAAGELGGMDAASSRPDLQAGVSNFKTNAPDIVDAADRLGIKPSEGTLSSDRNIQAIEAETAKNATFAGKAIGDERQAMLDGLKRNANGLLEEQTKMTEAQTGRAIKDGIKSQLESELKPIEQEYADLKPHFKQAQVSDAVKNPLADSILKSDLAQADPDGMGKIAQKLADRINGIKDVDALRIQKQFIGKLQDQAYTAKAPEYDLYRMANNGLKDIRTSALNEASAAGQIPESIAGRISSNDALYSSYKNNLQKLGVEGALGKIGTARDLLTKFGKLSDESFATKVFDMGDINQLNFFQKGFPKEFEMARRYKLRDIAEKSVSDKMGENGQLDLYKFLGHFSDKNMGSEARDVLLNGQSQKVKDIATIYHAIPGTINPPNTGAANILSRLFTPAGLIDNLSDAAKYALLKSQPYLNEIAEAAGGGKAGELTALQFARSSGADANPGAIKTMASYIGKVLKGDAYISKATRAVLDTGKTVIPSAIVDLSKRKSLDEKLKDLQANNQPLFDVGHGVAHYMPDHGAAMAQTAANGVTYLNSLRPSTHPQNPLDAPIVPNKAQDQAFNRALDIANQPLITLQAAKDGTLTHTDVGHMQKLYPDLYQGIVQKLHNELINATAKGTTVPYKTRIGLATFIGQPLDSTMTPQGIMAHQNIGLTPSQQKDPAAVQSHKGSLKALKNVALNEFTPDQARQARLLT